MKRMKKKDYINLLIISIIFIVIVLLTKGNDVYSSVTDNITQHAVIPEYFRTLFYNTFDLFPDFAFNLGAGQNIYNFAYYGLLNPVIMLSYLLPYISMQNYVAISSICLAYLSVILFYFFLRRHKFDYKISLITTICFMCGTALLFHTHRHVMFMNYMPFLIMGLHGVDNYFDKNDKRLLCISTVLIILMSFYYSIPGIICLVVYGVYRYIELNKKITFKKFICDGLKFVFPIIVAILITCVLLLPTFIALLNGRMDNEILVTLKDLLIPQINVSYLMYDTYGVGLTSISLFALANLFDKKRENKFIVIVLSLLIVFPLFNYLLNGFMYISSKALIPFLPLYSYLIALFLDKIFDRKLNIKYFIISSIAIISYVFVMNSDTYNMFYLDFIVTFFIILGIYKFKIKYFLESFIVVISIILCISVNVKDNLISKELYYSDSNVNQGKLTTKIDTFDRVNLYNMKLENVNNIYGNIDVYQNTVYSSINNSLYNKFFFDTFENVMQSRNRLILSSNKNIFFLMFMNNRYVISDDFNIVGYNKIDTIENTSLYENNNVLPLMYVSYDHMNINEFNNYSFPYTNEILINNSVLDVKTNNEYKTKIKEVSKDGFKLLNIDETIKYEDDKLIVSKNNSKLNIKVSDEVRDKILFISFEINEPQKCKVGDLVIDINNERNKLTCAEWKYYNGNTTFNYVIADKDLEELDIVLSKGTYNIENLKLYYIDYNDIKDVNKKVTKVNIDSEKTKNNKIYGNVYTYENGVVVTSIPYDKGFTIKVDGEEIEYFNVNTAFVGFNINKGNHNIEIIYNSPGKKIGLIISIIGLITYIIFIRKRK